MIALVVTLADQRRESERGVVEQVRTFHGVLRLSESNGAKPELRKRALFHGAIVHGQQFLDEELRRQPTTYYAHGSGIDLALSAVDDGDGRRIGAVGLGIGTVAAYGRAGDRIRFYEIDPEVHRFARESFTFLDDSDAEIDVVIGDARMSLETATDQAFDVLLLDAFSGDSVPVHLLTTEAFATWMRHLADDGVLAVHVSNRHLDLTRVIYGLADEFELAASPPIDSRFDPRAGTYASRYVLLSRDPTRLPRRSGESLVARSPDVDTAPRVLWTDDRLSLLDVLK